jgi:hypothetical protein
MVAICYPKNARNFKGLETGFQYFCNTTQCLNTALYFPVWHGLTAVALPLSSFSSGKLMTLLSCETNGFHNRQGLNQSRNPFFDYPGILPGCDMGRIMDSARKQEVFTFEFGLLYPVRDGGSGLIGDFELYRLMGLLLHSLKILEAEHERSDDF